jgi:hypothetical protein
MHDSAKRARVLSWLAAAVLVSTGAAAHAQQTLKKEVAGFEQHEMDLIQRQYRAQADAAGMSFGNDRIRPTAVPDIFGSGAVLTVGNVYMKVTNFGFVGNPFTNLSSDPSGQWPGASGVEYLNFFGLAIAGVNNFATDPKAVRRVSFTTEWRPATIDPEDRIYRAYDGIINGARFVNDDNDDDPNTGDQAIDEDFLDGRDNDNDGLIDEDHAALGQLVYSCVIRDDTQEAIDVVRNEKHVPLGLMAFQKCWAYSIPGFTDFNVIEWVVRNISGHPLDSLTIGIQSDIDAGPVEKSNYFQDDFDIPGYPSGAFSFPLAITDPRRQFPHASVPDVPDESPLCSTLELRINGFATTDDDGDEQKTRGTAAFSLVDHTIDPLGLTGPTRVGFKAFRSFTFGVPYVQGGNPTIDQQRFELLTGSESIDPETGFISRQPGDQKGDFSQWASVGPWRNVPNGGEVSVTYAFMVAAGTYQEGLRYASDYAAFEGGAMQQDALIDRYPLLEVALAAKEAFEGIYERRDGFPKTDFHGREAKRRLNRGEPPTFMADCRDIQGGGSRQVNDLGYTWFDFDCDYCTGVYVVQTTEGLFHKTWNAEAPPPNPNLNVSATYNYTDNPDRTTAPAQDNAIQLAWDNLSEVTKDPKSSWFDARGYQIWKVAGWTRPVGSPGPGDSDWSLVGEYRLFDYRALDGTPIPDNRLSDGSCPKVNIPNWTYPDGRVDSATVEICLQRGEMWNRQSGHIIRPDPNVNCNGYPNACVEEEGCRLGTDCEVERRTTYPIGRYRYLDREVKNGFMYFYSVTAFDSTGEGSTIAELKGRRSAVEAEGVVPQSGTKSGKSVWVVPNPYRGFENIQERPSSWDLTPNATDPTGTHVDFLGLPAGTWTIRIFTVAGDLVQTIRHDDPVNDSVRGDVLGSDGVYRSGTNRQQDTANDGQARWNLISRNGQDVVSGIYIFTVDSSEGTQRGKFVIIR